MVNTQRWDGRSFPNWQIYNPIKVSKYLKLVLVYSTWYTYSTALYSTVQDGQTDAAGAGLDTTTRYCIRLCSTAVSSGR